MKRIVAVILIAAVAALAMVADKPLTQEEFDVIVEREMFKFRHHDDWVAEVDYWKRRGATDEMFAEAYAKIARRTMDIPQDDENKCCRSICCVARFSSQEHVLTNLMFIAENSKIDAVRERAIWAWHSKVPSERFLNFAERMVVTTNLGYRAAAELMSCLYEDCKTIGKRDVQLRDHMLRSVKRHLEVGGKGSVVADQVLLRCDEQYENSDFRKQVARMMLDPISSPLKGNPYVDQRKEEAKFRLIGTVERKK